MEKGTQHDLLVLIPIGRGSHRPDTIRIVVLQQKKQAGQ